MANPYEGTFALIGRNGHSEAFMREKKIALDLNGLQQGQHRHDEIAHRDVLALSAQRRITHFTLHFAKYAGALVAAGRIGSRTSTERIITDSLIIALASANSLGIDLERALWADSACLDESLDLSELALRFAEIVGEMAKACEAFDHAHERYPSFDVLERAIPRLTRVILLCAASEHLSFERAVLDRWGAVEAKARNPVGETAESRRPAVV